jgi:hypothetical protein
MKWIGRWEKGDKLISASMARFSLSMAVLNRVGRAIDLNFAGGVEMHKVKILAILMLSAGLFSLSGPSSFAAAPSFQYCKADVQRLCKGMMPGGGKIMKCLKAHENDLTVGCAKELKALKAKMGK